MRGSYRLSATAGQPAAGGDTAGGNYGLLGGFRGVRGPAPADLSVALADSPDPVVGLQPLTYTVLVDNLGPSTATSVSAVIRLPAQATFLGVAGAGWRCGEASGVLTCEREGLAVGATAQITALVTAPPESGVLSLAVSVAAAESDR